MKKLLQYSILFMFLAFVVYQSVYIKKLNEVNTAKQTFDVQSFSRKFVANDIKLSVDSSLELMEWRRGMLQDPETTFSRYTHALNIGNIRYGMVHGEGRVVSITENEVTLRVKQDSASVTVYVQTEFVYGNAVKEATGTIKLTDFNSTTDLNNVSKEVNKIIRTELLPNFKSNVRVGQFVYFAGAIEENKEHVKVNEFELYPVQLIIRK